MTGWSLKRIQREAWLREWGHYADTSTYHLMRDGPRQQDWTWAVDTMRDELSEDAWQAAHDLYRAQQTARGDTERHDRPRVDGIATAFDTAMWAQQRAAAIERAAVAHVWHSPERNPMRWATFVCVFHWRQPTLAEVRINGRPGGARHDANDAPLRMKESETKARIAWCCNTVAEHFAGIAAGCGRS